MLNVGIAGYGFMGRFHHAGYEKAEGGRVTAVFDVNPKAFEANETAGNIGVASADKKNTEFFTDYDAFIKAVDVVDICTPTPYHLPLVTRAFEAGRHVLLEKPMALTLEECGTIIALAEKAGTTFMVAHCVRFWPGYDVLQEAAKTGRYGRLCSVTFNRVGGCSFWSPWFLDETKSGGAVLDIMIHDFDMCRVLGGMPEKVTAVGSHDVLGKGSGVNYVNAQLLYNDPEAPALSVIGGWMTSETFPFTMTFDAQFEDAAMRFGGDPEKPLVIYPRKGEPETPVLAPGDGYEAEVNYFLSVIGKKPERCMPAESRDSVAIALAAKESILTGDAVAPKM